MKSYMTKNEVEAPINSSILVWARKSSGMEIEDVIQKLGKKIQRLNKELLNSWETGDQYPTLKQLQILADLYKRPLASFFLTRIPLEEPLPKDFRTLDSKRAYRLTHRIRFAIRWARRVQKISSSLLTDINKEYKFKYQKYLLSEDPISLSEKIRSDFNYSKETQLKLKTENDAFEYLRAKIEGTGVIILKTPSQYSFPVDQARALSFVDREPYVILINNKDLTCAKIFSLIHEFAHLLIRETSLCNTEYIDSNNSTFLEKTEVFCNQFASNFLVPDQLIKSYNLKSILLEEDAYLDVTLNQLSHEFKVSKHVILRKLLDLNLINSNIYRNKVASWRNNKLPRGKQFGKNVPSINALKTNGLKYSGLVLEAYKNDRITYSDASDYLNLKSKYLPQLEHLVFE